MPARTPALTPFFASHAGAHQLKVWVAGYRSPPGSRGDQETFVTYTIAAPCIDVKDKSCIEECPVDCIYEGTRMLYIHPDECVDCGACEPVCPVEAIYYEDDVPVQWSAYTKINADFFAELGSPGAASNVGMTENDPQPVKDAEWIGHRNRH
jgi:NAD-dependent dihydropyrimidine dehydrogenase PreA subunit